MKEEILTAKEWLKKEDLELWITDVHAPKAMEHVMEKYANYKNRKLEDRIKKFREMLNIKVLLKNQSKLFLKHPEILEGSVEDRANEYDLSETMKEIEEYDKHFNIEKISQ